MSEPLEVRSGRASDLPALLEQYNHYVREGHAIFDEVEATLVERERWFAGYSTDGPHRLLVAEAGGVVLGFCSSQPYRAHPAFRESVEVSVMLAPDSRGQGVGTRLYEHLFAELAGEPLHRAYAGIALPNPASCALHERFGFTRIGVFDEYAQKRGRRISSAWYEKRLG